MDDAAHHHSQLLPLRSLGDAELDFELDLLEIDHYMKQGALDTALKAVNAKLRHTGGDSLGGKFSRGRLSVVRRRLRVNALLPCLPCSRELLARQAKWSKKQSADSLARQISPNACTSSSSKAQSSP